MPVRVPDSPADALLARLREGKGPPVRVPELAEALGCSVSFIEKRILAGKLKAGRVGRHYRVPVKEAARFAREAGAL